MKQKVQWQATFDPDGSPLVLVEFGDLVESTTFPGRGGSRGVPTIGGDFTEFTDHASDLAASLEREGARLSPPEAVEVMLDRDAEAGLAGTDKKPFEVLLVSGENALCKRFAGAVLKSRSGGISRNGRVRESAELMLEPPVTLDSSHIPTMIAEWLRDNTSVKVVMVTDADAGWMEVEVTLPDELDGSIADGWSTDDADSRIRLQWSSDLIEWTEAGWSDAPGKVTVDNGDGTKTWFGRYDVPRKWYNAIVDLRMTSRRHGKSITGIDVGGSTLSLPNYPYLMPDDAAQLQADLIADGLTGAVVSTTIGDWEVDGADFAVSRVPFAFVMDGADVTDVRKPAGFSTVSISLPNYPYTMPTDEALLESDLQAAGYSYASVQVLKDEWDIYLPDYESLAFERDFRADITPGDPRAVWDFFGNFAGYNSAALAEGEFENLRSSEGKSALENPKAFARLKLS